MEEFLRLKARLEAEGLFDPARKRALAPYPTRLAVVTSSAAAAWRDVMTALARRSPHVEVWLIPAPVQGAEAPPALVAALEVAGRQPVDAVLVCRGGGSIEDLWAFNDERVVRAVAACPVPVISGVGHETDFTLTDFAADVRAPTPTAAAELAAPRHDQLLRELDLLQDDLTQRVTQRLDRDMQRLDRLASRLARPAQVVHAHHRRLAVLAQRMDAAWPQRHAQQTVRLDGLERRLTQALHRRIEQAGQRLAVLSARLSAVDPDQALQRGYARLSQADGSPLTSVHQTRVRQTVQAHLADGTLDLKVSARHAGPT
jgi:exodeoxyribonuclease VII large subunit